MPRRCVFSYLQDVLCRDTACSVRCLDILYIMFTYRRGAYALLVSTEWATFLRASEREASNSAGLHAFFV